VVDPALSPPPPLPTPLPAPLRFPHPATGELFASPVPPGTGWPGDPAETSTPVAASSADVVDLAASADLADLDARVSVCRACPRLVAWRERVAVEKRASFTAEPYWGRPIAGWGSAEPRVLIVGLAPAAHGGNRTGRVFTGDRSGDWLFASLFRVGLAATPTSVHAADGQRLLGTRVLAVVRCAPPDNKPTPDERDSCQPWLDRELALVLPGVRAVVCLGGFAWAAAWAALGRHGYVVPRPRPRFGHGVVVGVEAAVEAGVEAGARSRAADAGLTVLGCYHPSQQNTFTGRLTEPMLDSVLARAKQLSSETPG
jgi:uracil-DNA glycosylase family 4